MIDTNADGWLSVKVGFDVEEIACEYALGFGDSLKVIEPESLKEKVIAAAHSVVRMYAEK